MKKEDEIKVLSWGISIEDLSSDLCCGPSCFGICPGGGDQEKPE